MIAPWAVAAIDDARTLIERAAERGATFDAIGQWQHKKLIEVGEAVAELIAAGEDVINAEPSDVTAMARLVLAVERAKDGVQ